MSHSKDQSARSEEVKLKQKKATVVSSVAIRIRQKSKTRLEQLLRQANKDRPGRKVKADDLISYSLDLLTEHHMAAICDKMLSNRDRIELLFQQFLRDHRGATREDFLGVLLTGKLTQ